MDKLKEIKERWAKGTRGPWDHKRRITEGGLHLSTVEDMEGEIEIACQGQDGKEEDIEKMACAPQDIADLVEMVENSEESLDVIKESLHAVIKQNESYRREIVLHAEEVKYYLKIISELKNKEV